VLGLAVQASLPLLFLGFFLFGGATAANLQARYAAVISRRRRCAGRHLSLIVWATTIGAVAGPHLAAPAGVALSQFGIPTLAAPRTSFSALLFVHHGYRGVRPAPPRPCAGRRNGGADGGAHRSLRAGLQAIIARAPAVLGVTAMAVGHMVMVGIMAMTPVHIRGAGMTRPIRCASSEWFISVHIAGMYAFAPLIGWLTDRFGRRPLIFADRVADNRVRTRGWRRLRQRTPRCGTVCGWDSAGRARWWRLDTAYGIGLPLERRASAQGLSDLIMAVAGASAGALSAWVVSVWSYPVAGVGPPRSRQYR